MNLNRDILLIYKMSDGLLLFPAGMITDANFGDAITLDEVRYDQFGRPFQYKKVLPEHPKVFFEF